MADLSVTAGCGHLQPAQTVEMTDTEEIIHIGEDVKAAKEKLEAHVMEIEFKIHRFPAKLRGFGTDMDYIAPSIVAIGPYYHGVPELQAMEEVKRMAVYYFCERLADSPEEVYKKILPVACDVRGCYTDVDALEGITDDDFAAMMFFDGCFFSGKQSTFTSVIRSKGRDSILRDMLLLENQIPWPVLQLLTDIKYGPGHMWYCFIDLLISGFRVSWSREEQPFIIDEDFKRPHLLGLIHSHQVRLRSPVEVAPQSAPMARITFSPRKKEKRVVKLTVTTSAAELTEIGVKLTPNRTTQFFDMKVERGPCSPHYP